MIIIETDDRHRHQIVAGLSLIYHLPKRWLCVFRFECLSIEPLQIAKKVNEMLNLTANEIEIER